MKKPFYEIDPETKHHILEITKKAKELDMGNVSFQHYHTKGEIKTLTFYMHELADYWELRVLQEGYDSLTRKNIRRLDQYRISEDSKDLIFTYKEED